MDKNKAVNRIHELLRSISKPRFDEYVVGQPRSVSAERVVAFWYLGDEPPPEGPATLGNAMVYEVFMVRGYWKVSDAPQLRESREGELWDFVRNSKAAFRGDSTLNGNVTDLDVGEASTGIETFANGNTRRVAFYELRVKDLEAEAIAP